MGKINTVIEINGQRYDAKTGAPVRTGSSARPQAQSSRRAAPAVAAHRPATARTLMRHAVKKPAPTAGKFKAQSHTDSLAIRPLAEVSVSASAQRLDQRRLHKAKHTPKSDLITHFAEPTLSHPTPVVTAQPPLFSQKPVTQPAAQRPTKARSTAELLEQAVHNATSHQQPPVKARRARRGHKSALAGGLVLSLLLITLAGSQSLNQVRLHVASAKAGLDASLPAYQPAGYSLSQLHYSPGEVATEFHSNSNDTGYSVVRQRSAWDSNSLRDEYVAPLDPNFRTVTSSGRPVYLYGDHNATWIDSGTWVMIQSDGSLNDHQLLSIANSL